MKFNRKGLLVIVTLGSLVAALGFWVLLLMATSNTTGSMMSERAPDYAGIMLGSGAGWFFMLFCLLFFVGLVGLTILGISALIAKPNNPSDRSRPTQPR